MKTLRPIVTRQKYETEIEKKIAKMLHECIFEPIFVALKELPQAAQKRNAGPQDALKGAIATGKVIYEGGVFTGSFSAQISKALHDLGAKWVAKKKAYSLPESKIPTDIRIEISKAKNTAVEVTDKINKILTQASENYKPVEVVPETEKIIDDLTSQLQGTIPEKLSLPYAIEGYVEEKITREYSENLNLFIKQWYDEEILRLRRQVQESTMQGYRAAHLYDGIQAEYGVSRRKAKFLSRQETSLFVSAYRKATYENMGLIKYKWSSSMDRRVRPTHRVMHGKICRWDDPTVYFNGREWIKRSNIGGVELHPGTDFGCRCIAIPLLNEAGLNI
jgi:SPP1 gp7 family putative phage head morphogenesis protein